ncbi:MAG TPA: hypothetical protein VJ183_08375 [Chloroflexia bacterium]|nr:hypothetical protein [Chloroflexia bacterium]
MRIDIQISLGRDGFPVGDELELRYALEDLLEENGIAVVGGGAGMGVMDLSVEVDDARSALLIIDTFIKQYHIEDITTVEVEEDT